MTYKERLLELHNIAVEKLLAYGEFESGSNVNDAVCGMCDPETYQRKLDAYQSLQDAIGRRNMFAKEINEAQIDIESHYPQKQTH